MTASGKQPLSWWRLILLGLLGAALLLIIVFHLVDYLVSKRLGNQIVRIKRANEPVTFADLAPRSEEGSSGDNAAGYYSQVLADIQIVRLDDLKHADNFCRTTVRTKPRNEFPKEIRQNYSKIVDSQRSVLEKIDRAADMPLPYFDIGLEQGLDVAQGRTHKIITAFLLSTLRAYDLYLHSFDDAAVDSLVSNLKMMRVFDTYPAMNLQAVKCSLLSQLCPDINILLEQASPSERTLARLQNALSEVFDSDSLERVFLTERVYRIETARNLLPEGVVKQYLPERFYNMTDRVVMPGKRRVQMRLRQHATKYFCDMEKLITASRGSWQQIWNLKGDNNGDGRQDPVRLIAVGASLMKTTGIIITIVDSTMLMTAIERYRLSNGRPPKSLDELVPGYIDAIPLDMFTGDRLLYKPKENAYIVYGVGSDGKDDGGAITPQGAERKSSPDWGLQFNPNPIKAR